MRKFKILFFIIFFIIIAIFVWRWDFSGEEMDLGVTFSKPYAEELGLNWQEVYLAILDDLGVKKLRLSAYWPEIEKVEGEYDFSNLDWQFSELKKREGEVILVIGRRLPRWPECHDPAWLKDLEKEKVEEKALALLTETVNYYKDLEIITAWQVENEPLLSLFGKCPDPDKDFLAREVNLVKSLDDRPIIITDSGELSLWLRTSKYADILGITMYRVVWNKYWGYFKHIFPPAFYRGRAELVKKIFNVDRVIVSELQGEPWIPNEGMATEFPIKEQMKSMDLEQLKENIDFAKRSGFDEVYLWGAEWWYWLKMEGEDSFWEEMRGIF